MNSKNSQEFSLNDNSIWGEDSSNGPANTKQDLCEVLKDTVNVVFDAGIVTTWDQFLNTKPPCSISIGGYVFGPPSFEKKGPYINFNHLHGVDQLATRSSASQVYLALKQGLSKSFNVNGNTFFNVYINEPNPDKCLALWLLKNYKKVEAINMPIDQDKRLRLLLGMQDLIDVTGGSYRIDPSSTVMKAISWIFQPYYVFRSSGSLNNIDNEQLEKITSLILYRIDKYIVGEYEQLELDTSFDLEGEYQWGCFVKEVGPYCRMKLINDGKDLVISYLPNKDGTFKYNILKRGVFIPFSLEGLYEKLNEYENIQPFYFDSWNGSNISGTSPKKAGSKIPPKEFIKIVNNYHKSLPNYSPKIVQVLKKTVQELLPQKSNYNIIANPGKVINWDEFIHQTPTCSIALDGYVFGAPTFDPIGLYINFNHHEGVDRLSTRCTASQIFIALKQGLSKSFKQNGNTFFNIYLNDPDQDTCLAVWLLKNYKIVEGIDMPLEQDKRLRLLLSVEDMLDVTGGCYRVDPESSIMKQIAWIFKPYTDARLSGIVNSLENDSTLKIIERVCDRIDLYLNGNAKEIDLDTRYEVIGDFKWGTVFQEIGTYSKLKLINDGKEFLISFIKNQDGTYRYTLLKKSPFIPISLDSLYEKLNLIESKDKMSFDCWGGSNIVGGSPRISGSKITPKEMIQIVDEYHKKIII
ncbi:MAG: hypothetical protein V3575_05790 [Candidatus Absconditabacteria bacterium]